MFNLWGDKGLGPNGFPMFFYQHYWNGMKGGILDFLQEFHNRGKLSKNLGATFSPLIPAGAKNVKNFKPIGLIGCVYKILLRVFVGRLQKVLPKIIFQSEGTFVHGRQILDGVLVASERVHSKF